MRREITRYRKAAGKLEGLRWRDWKDLVRAQLALARAQREMRSLPTGDMVSDDVSVRGLPVPARIDDARRIALAVNRAAEFGFFRPRCLVRSRALRKMLDEDGLDGAEVRVGVLLAHGRFLAHAWVEYGGQVVGDDPEKVSRFVPMPGINVADLE